MDAGALRKRMARVAAKKFWRPAGPAERLAFVLSRRRKSGSDLPGWRVNGREFPRRWRPGYRLALRQPAAEAAASEQNHRSPAARLIRVSS